MTLSPSLKIMPLYSFSAFPFSLGLSISWRLEFRLSTPSIPFRIGERICISLKPSHDLLNFGSLTFISSLILVKISSGPSSCIKKKSFPFLFSNGISPLFILWAFIVIRLVSDCLNISWSFVTLTHPLSIKSLSTFPGPTDGSWSTSPTITSLVPIFIAFKRLDINDISIIEASSIIITSHSRGDSSPFANTSNVSSPVKPISKSLCIVFASLWVASVIRFAALPVGAAITTLKLLSSNMSIIQFIMVVFPVPGPPVIISTPCWKAPLIASFWLSAKAILFFFWNSSISSSTFIFRSS